MDMKLSVCFIILIGVFVAAEERVKRQASYSTQGAIRYPSPQGAIRHPPPQGANRQPPPQVSIRHPPPQGAIRQPPPQGTIRQPPPQGAFRQPPPQVSIRHPPPQGAIRQPPPQGTIRHPPPQGAIRQPPPQGAAKYPLPQVGGNQNKPLQQYRSPPSGGASGGSRHSPGGKPNIRKSFKQPLKERFPQEEEPSTPDPLSVLLDNSKFRCSDKHDGYYADVSVSCKVFHYCVGGSKHSWLCPGNTVFHQVHLNCVPSNQDICSQSEKYHLVNDYLYKPLEERGPNNTIRYHQRYYPQRFLYGGQAPPHPPPRQERPAPKAQGYGNYDYSDAPASAQYEQGPSAQSQPSRRPSSYGPSSPARQAPPRNAPSPHKPYDLGSYEPSSSSGQYANFPEIAGDFPRAPNTRRISSSGSGATSQQGNSYRSPSDNGNSQHGNSYGSPSDNRNSQHGNSYGSPSDNRNSQQYARVKYDNY
ncbi:uncharacterized protein LOC143245151 [Tachypleus tridentatus]|uniref:uncharacterized protein LOC143245151 n=1 Tax=Tachypleus tridentatus TaxID=6853 RepID=UPI003FCF2744